MYFVLYKLSSTHTQPLWTEQQSWRAAPIMAAAWPRTLEEELK